jgi:hypothetical protein
MSDSIHSRIEDRETELGHALSADEVCDVLKEYGPPLVAASRFWKQQQLIGSRWLPYYWSTLQTALWCVVAINVLVLFGTSLTSSGTALAAFGKAWGTAIVSLLAAGGALTLVYALLERFSTNAATVSWDPRTLESVSPARSVSRITSACEFLANGLIGLWLLSWTFVRESFAALVPGSPSAAHTLPGGLAPIWHLAIAALVASTLVQSAIAFVTLVRPSLVLLRTAILAATNAALAIVAFSIAASRPLVVPSPDALSGATGILFWSLIITGGFLGITALVSVRKALWLLRVRGDRGVPAGAVSALAL